LYSITKAGRHGHIAPIRGNPCIKKLTADTYLDLRNGEVKNFDIKAIKDPQNLMSAKQKCLDIIHTNLTETSLFISNTTKVNNEDRDLFFYWMNRFTKSKIFRENFGDKFLYTVEKQKRGALHSHLICFEPLRPWGSVQFRPLINEWRKIIGGIGSVKVKDIDKPDNIGKYLAKYILKEFASVEKYKRVYIPSKGLEQPRKWTADYKEFKAFLPPEAKEKWRKVKDKEGKEIEALVGWYW